MAATSSVPLPKPLGIHGGNVAENWKRFKNSWNNYVIAAGFENKSPRQKTALLLSVIGEDAQDVVETFEWDAAEDRWDIEKVIEKLEKYCIPRKNTLFETYVFNCRKQEEEEAVDAYVTSLRRLAETCEFKDKERAIRDQVVFGLRDLKVKEKLLREPDPTLARVIEIVRANEVANKQAKAMDDGRSEDVHKVRTAQETGGGRSQGKRSNVREKGDSSGRNSNHPQCKFCAYRHELKKERCPAYGKTCNKCGDRNHFAAVCTNPTRQQNELTTEEEQPINYAYVYTLRSKTHKRKTSTLTVANTEKQITFQIDTGASVNVMSFADYCKATADVTGEQLRPTNLIIVAYGGRKIPVRGKRDILMKLDGSPHNVEVNVVNVKATPLLCLQTCERLGIVKILKCDQESLNALEHAQGLSKEDILRKYPDVFEGIGKIPGKLHIRLSNDAVPVVHPPRRVPVTLRDDLKLILNQMERDDIIAKVNEPTDWVSSMLVKKEPNKLRICLDPKDLNNAIKREHYPLPRIEEVVTRMADVKVFSVLDVKAGFWHVELDDSSSLLTTFNTPFGRYRWKRMAFGLNLAPEIWQRRMHEFVEDLPGLEVIADDFLVTGKGATIELATLDHDQNLERFLQKARKHNLKLNAEKMKIKLEEVRFIGHILTRDGLKIDPRKVEAVMKMPDPKNADDLRRILGMVQYLSKFLPRLSQITEPLRKLTLKDAEWSWVSEHQEAWVTLKTMVSSAPVLAYYDSRKEVTIQADASQAGLGAVLMQEGRPVVFTSRTMTATEQNYAQIEKEMLAIVHACSKFDEYIYGKSCVTVQTDHKPLENIFKKPMNVAPKRLQRMLLFLHNYDLKVTYKPGPEMHIADTLSRAYLPDTRDPKEVMLIDELELVNELRSISLSQDATNEQRQIKEIAAATAQDPTLQAVMQLVRDGWPSSKHQVPNEARPYYDCRSELTMENGVLFKLDRIVIPALLRNKYKRLVHESHIGIENCLRRAREYLYWPRMNAEIKDFISQCDLCNSMRPEQQKETMTLRKIPDRAWKALSTDLFQLGNQHFLVVVDHFSSFVECDRVHSLEPDCIISLMKKQFARYGIPEKVYSDCGTQYTSKKFQDFARTWGFDHITSSPRFPQSNGKAENAVKICKGLLKKSLEGGGDFYKALLDWRNTPTPDTHQSAAQRMFGRRTRSSLPAHPSLLNQKGGKEVKEKLAEAKSKQCNYYNRSAKDLQPLLPGETVRIKLPGCHRWAKGIVLKEKGNRSYEVNVRGMTYTRNRRQLLRTGEQILARDEEGSDFEEDLMPESQENDPYPEVTRPQVDQVPPQVRRGSRERRPVVKYQAGGP